MDYGTIVERDPGAYAKLDFLANYKFNDNFAMFGRIENLTDARYEEVYNYGGAGAPIMQGFHIVGERLTSAPTRRDGRGASGFARRLGLHYIGSVDRS